MTMPTYAFPTKTIEARVRRRLLTEGEVLRKCRPDEGGDLGPYFTVDPHCGNPIRWNCDLELLARECGALPPWGSIKED
jgi:hypothetical protein